MAETEITTANLLYSAPETLEFDGIYHIQSDLWAAGVILYQLLSGKVPFLKKEPTEKIFAILNSEFEPLPEDIPTPLQRIVRQALAKNPSERFQTAKEMREELQNVLLKITHSTIVTTEILNEPDLFVLEKDINQGNELIDDVYDHKIHITNPDEEDNLNQKARKIKITEYPNSIQVGGMFSDGNGGGSRWTFYAVSDPIETVIAFYQTALGDPKRESKTGEVNWQFQDNDGYWQRLQRVLIFPESSITSLVEKGEIQNVPENTKTIVCLTSGMWRTDNSLKREKKSLKKFILNLWRWIK